MEKHTRAELFKDDIDTIYFLNKCLIVDNSQVYIILKKNCFYKHSSELIVTFFFADVWDVWVGENVTNQYQ